LLLTSFTYITNTAANKLPKRVIFIKIKHGIRDKSKGDLILGIPENAGL
jgi:hypothetical protein